jgi:hypothetical protein
LPLLPAVKPWSGGWLRSIRNQKSKPLGIIQTESCLQVIKTYERTYIIFFYLHHNITTCTHIFLRELTSSPTFLKKCRFMVCCISKNQKKDKL